MFAKRLKELRDENGISQAKLAELTNITQQAIGKWETGKSTPDPEMIVKLANLLDVSTDYLLGNTNIRRPIKTIPFNTFNELKGVIPDEEIQALKTITESVIEKYKK